MPTAARLVAALFYAALGWFVCDLVIPLLPDGTSTVWLHETMAFIGLMSGWTMAGARAGDGLRPALGYGLTTAALMVFWGVLIFAGHEMLDQSLKSRFAGPMQAIKAMLNIAMDYFRLISTPSIIITMIVGGLFGGWLAAWVSKRWT